MLSLAQLLVSDRPDACVVAERGGHALTLGRLRADVAANAARLMERRPRRAALFTQDSYWFLVGLLSLLQADAEILLPPNGQSGTLAAAAGDTDLLVTDQASGVTLVEGGATVPTGLFRRLDPETCRLDFFTSGSTGERKCIAKTLGQLEREIAVLDALWGDRLGAARILGMVSHQHIFGLTFRVLWPVMAGRCFGAATPFAWETLLPALAGPTALVVSPAHLARLGGIAPLASAQAPRAIFTAGAPLALPAAQEAEAILGCLPTEIFGSTETGAVAWRRQVSVKTAWTPLAGVELDIAECGALQIRSPFLPSGTVYDSPDRVVQDGDGFHFRGRSDRVVKIEGKRISLPEVERELRTLPEVEDCAVALLTESRDLLGAVLVLSAAGRSVLSGEGKRTLEQLLRHGLARTQETAGLPKRWRFVETLPVDFMGKPDRGAIMTQLTRQKPDAPIVQAARATEQGVELDLQLPPGLMFFDGHFERYPILPGVVQVDWAIGFARRHLQATGYPGHFAQLKFRRPIRPEDRLLLKLDRETSGGRAWLAFEYRRGDEICSSGKIGFAAS